MANRVTSVKGGRKRVSFGFVCFQVVLAYEVIVLCKCSGKYIDIYFKLEITFPSQFLMQMTWMVNQSINQGDRLAPPLPRGR